MGEVVSGPWRRDDPSARAPTIPPVGSRGLLEIVVFQLRSGLQEVVVRLDGTVMLWQGNVQLKIIGGEENVE